MCFSLDNLAIRGLLLASFISLFTSNSRCTTTGLFPLWEQRTATPSHSIQVDPDGNVNLLHSTITPEPRLLVTAWDANGQKTRDQSFQIEPWTFGEGDATRFPM